MTPSDKEAFAKVEKLLQLNCPSPEEELISLSMLAAGLPSTEEAARIRCLVLDIDDLVAQVRWHLGQALLLMETQPHILQESEPEDVVTKIIPNEGFPSPALLLLRGYIRRPDQVLHSDLSEPRRGGTAAGWIFHMMIDSAIYRIIAALDRVARVLWYAAGLGFHNNGRPVRVYFRSGKIQKIDQAIQNNNSRELLKLAQGPLLAYIIDYRDNFTHSFKVYSQIACSSPLEEWTTPEGKRYILSHNKLDAETLFSLGNAAYHQLLDILKPTLVICEDRFGKEDGFPYK